MFFIVFYRTYPCCINVPIANQKLLGNVKSFWNTRPAVSSQGSGLAHSYGENLATIQIVIETKTYANKMYIQISRAKGFMKLNSSVSGSAGALNKIEMPKFMKGLVKSMTVSLA